MTSTIPPIPKDYELEENSRPSKAGRYGVYGGQYVPETLNHIQKIKDQDFGGNQHKHTERKKDEMESPGDMPNGQEEKPSFEFPSKDVITTRRKFQKNQEQSFMAAKPRDKCSLLYAISETGATSHYVPEKFLPHLQN